MLVPLADLALRARVPVAALAFRGIEAAEAAAVWPAPFAADVRYTTARTWGDLSNLANLRALRVPHPDTLVTDPLGCRNDPALAAGRHVDALFLGSSFIAGAGVPDVETIPVHLSRLTGRRVYNAALAPNPPRALVTRLADHFGFRRGPVLREVLMRSTVLAGINDPAPAAPAPPGTVARTAADLRDALPLVGLSPVKILTQQALHALQDDRLLPNLPHPRVIERALAATGEPTLMLSDDQDLPAVPARDALTDWLTAQGYQPVVVLMPTKFQALRPYLAGESPADGPHEAAIRELEHAYRAAGYTVLNLFPALRAAAGRPGPALFWADDSHPTPAGARAAAAELARLWHPSAP